MSGLCHNCGTQIDEDELTLCGRCRNLEPAPVTDKDREEAVDIVGECDCSGCTYLKRKIIDAISRIRKAAYEEGLRDGSKRE